MTTLAALQSLVAFGESETLEFKRSTAELRRAGESRCACLNGEGGQVLVGVGPKGQIRPGREAETVRTKPPTLSKLDSPTLSATQWPTQSAPQSARRRRKRPARHSSLQRALGLKHRPTFKLAEEAEP